MHGTVRSLLERRAAAVPGRDRERRLLLELVERDGPLVALVHGIAGIGKTTLLRAFAADARGRGARVAAIDGRGVEPSEAGVLAALGDALEAPAGSPAALGRALAARAGRTVVAIDGYDAVQTLDGWVRARLLPELPASARLVLAAREPPVEAWLRDLGDLMRELPLGALAPADAERVLRAAGVPAERAIRVNALAHGHPLALQLAARAILDRPEVDLGGAAHAPVIRSLAETYLAGLAPAERRALDAACVVRRVTISLLEAMLGGDEAQPAFERLARLPFAEVGREGLIVHDTLREVVVALLRASDPATHHRHRVAAWRQSRRELRAAPAAERWRTATDLLHLVDNPVVREAFFPASPHAYSAEPARPADGPAIDAIVRAHESDEDAAILREWWRAVPEAFVVARERDGAVAAFHATCEPAALPAALVARDPVAAGWREHLRRHPVPHGRRVLMSRHRLTRDHGARLCPAFGALCLDTYTALRDDVRRLYAATRDAELFAPVLASLGYEVLPAAVDLGGTDYHLLVNDLGPAGFEGWLSAIGVRDLGLDAAGPLDLAGRRLLLDGRPVDLTPLELDLLSYLHEREGRVVRREALLEGVWGHRWRGGGNALEAAVSALRRKLGARAAALETVRGVGYRLAPLD